MKYIKDLEKQPKTWKPYVAKVRNEIHSAHTGWIGEVEGVDKRFQENDFTTKVNNFVFEASFAPIGFERGRSSVAHFFTDVHTNVVYSMGTKSVSELIECLCGGVLKITNDGNIYGLFTFTKQGESVYIKPYTNI